MNWIKKAWNEIELNPKIIRQFGFILSGFFLFFPLIGNGIKIWLFKASFHYWIGWPFLSVAALLINLFLPTLMTTIYHVAMFVAHQISWVVMRVLLSVIFYVVLTPVSVAMRVMGKDILDQNIDKNAGTYWKKKTSEIKPERYERLF